jgi:hypothetical protein
MNPNKINLKVCDRCRNHKSVKTVYFGTWKKPETREKIELCLSCYDKWGEIWSEQFQKKTVPKTKPYCERILSLFLKFMNEKVKVMLI